MSVYDFTRAVAISSKRGSVMARRAMAAAGADLMVDAPSSVTEAQLAELHINVRESKTK